MKRKKCKTEGCKNKAYLGKNFCCKCRNRRWRQNNYLSYVYLTNKNNAKRRNKEWDLTFEEFSEFCKETGYDQKKGRTPLALSIDRKINWKGYTKENIRAITVHDNSSKRDKIDPEFEKIEIPCPF